MPELLPVVDSDPHHWGPDHLDVVVGLNRDERRLLVAEGNRQGRDIDPDDDDDTGLDG